MAEKVRSGVDGLHFEARNPVHLADTLTRALIDKDLWQQLVKNIRQPPSYSECAERHLRLVAG
jgi:hypothetical protein